VPRTGNASLSWRYRRFSTRVLYNFTGSHIANYDANNPARRQYRYRYEVVNWGAGYQFRPWLQFTVDVANVFNESQRMYRYVPSQMSSIILNGTTITVGVNGRF